MNFLGQGYQKIRALVTDIRQIHRYTDRQIRTGANENITRRIRGW